MVDYLIGILKILNFRFFFLKKEILNLETPKNITFLWNIGSLLGITLVIQIFTGILLTWWYTPRLNSAFNSIERMERTLESVFVVRFIHINGVNLFFLLIYTHMIRGIWVNSFFKDRRIWVRGLLLYVILIAIAFLGYTLPWGQISLWGRTVITNLLSVIPYIGPQLVIWIWQGFSIQEFTIKLFFRVHFFLPFILLILILIHLIVLHQIEGRNNKLIKINNLILFFSPYFVVKDLVTILVIMRVLFVINKNNLLDAENWLNANEMVSPIHIKPEWYLLYLYAILRSIPRKSIGFLALVAALLGIGFLVIAKLKFRLIFFLNFQVLIIIFWINFLFLTWIGGIPVEYPYYFIGKWTTLTYFSLLFLFWSFQRIINLFNF